MRNRRRNFTLVELLVVIGIIAVLAGMLMAGIMYAPAKAQKAKAQAEITTLVNAIKQYESAYGVLPIPDGVSGDNIVFGDSDSDSKKYRKMIAILQDTVDEIKGTDGDPWENDEDTRKKDAKKNKRHSKFLDVQGNDVGQYVDPWGKNYFIALDGDYDGKITTSDIDGVNATSNVYRFSVVVWSKGNDKKSNTTKTDKTNEDNVYSFPTTWSSSTGHNISK